MGEHLITVDEAKKLCSNKIKECVAKYIDIVKDTKKKTTDLSPNLRKYVEAMQYSLNENVVWNSLCPRYHQGANYNEFQLCLMENGVGKSRLDSDARFDLAFSSQMKNAANDSSGVKAVNNVNDLNSVNGHQGDNRHGTRNKSARKKKD